MQVGASARRATVAALAIMAVVSRLVATPARAATVPAYAAWTFGGSAGAYTGTMSLGPGFATATFSSNSTSGAATGLQTGASTWLPAGSPFGAVFGSSENRPYVNLRPAPNTATRARDRASVAAGRRSTSPSGTRQRECSPAT